MKAIKERILKIKTKLGICTTTGCFRRAAYDVEAPALGIKRCMCEKHLNEFEKLLNDLRSN
ncbi:hypothetical protein [Clostridium chrysemydis]|uniref:hypothetical protein n=1 Tax=Clostridium chrysemydis TaxID=2665504 RepID=UPI001883346C|nr:hypothetical protein [Clostridium chrysemydis]